MLLGSAGSAWTDLRKGERGHDISDERYDEHDGYVLYGNVHVYFHRQVDKHDLAEAAARRLG